MRFIRLFWLLGTATSRQVSKVSAYAGILALGCALNACKTTQKHESKDEEGNIPWSEIVSMRSYFMSAPKHERFAALEPAPLVEKKVTSLEDLASVIELQKPRMLYQGLYGKRNNAVVYVSTKDVIPNEDKLYWVMVRVLSERYGCFIKGKEVYMQMTRFKCRDQRTVVMQKHSTEHYMLFYSKQYDRWGREIFM